MIEYTPDYVELPESGLLVSETEFEKFCQSRGNEAREYTQQIGDKAFKWSRFPLSLLAAAVSLAGASFTVDHSNNTDSGIAYASSLEQTSDCQPNYGLCTSFEYQGSHWDWKMNNLLSDPDDPNKVIGTVHVFKNGGFFQSVRPNKPYYPETAIPDFSPGGGSVAITGILAYPDLGIGIIATDIRIPPANYFPRGGELITDLLDPGNLSKRIKITDSGLPQQVFGDFEPLSLVNRSSQLWLVRQFTHVIIPSSGDGLYDLAFDKGRPSGTNWIKEQALATATPTATNTPSPTSTKTPEATNTPSSITQARGFAINSAPVGMSWLDGMNETSYGVFKFDNRGANLAPNGILARDSTSYVYNSILTSPTCYWVVAFNQETVLNYSDLFCIIPNIKTLTNVPQGFRVGLDRNMASISWDPSTTQDRALVVFTNNQQNLLTIPRGSSSISYDTKGLLTCYDLLAVQDGNIVGLTDMACIVPVPRSTPVTGAAARN